MRCARCGGPVNARDYRCEYCGAKAGSLRAVRPVSPEDVRRPHVPQSQHQRFSSTHVALPGSENYRGGLQVGGAPYRPGRCTVCGGKVSPEEGHYHGKHGCCGQMACHSRLALGHFLGGEENPFILPKFYLNLGF